MKFEKKYTEYWKNNIKNPIDGLAIAGSNEVNHFLPLLAIKKDDYLLDLGCSFGRMYSILASVSNHIYGIDPDSFAVESALNEGYIDVKVGDAENIKYDDHFFDKIFCWAVYDVVDHYNGLLESNRVLKINGKILLTGKIDSYYHADTKAFIAEKNAFLKSFPNHFVDIELLLKNIDKLGFELEKLYIFPNRGDFGKLEYFEVEIPFETINGYEYLMVLKKIKDIPIENYIKLDSPHSKTAKNLATKEGFDSVKDYFTQLGID
jgi:SAM-dependent methyltransferase